MAALTELKKSGRAGVLGQPVPVHRRHDVLVAAAPVRRHALRRRGRQGRRFNSDPAVEACTWLVDLVKQGYSPANVGQDADYLALKSGKNAFNWNGIWQINDLKKSSDVQWGVAPLPQIGSKPAAWANSHKFTHRQAAHRRPANKVAGAKVFINWLSRALAGLGQGRPGAGPQGGPRERRVQGADRGRRRSPRSWTTRHFPPAAPGIGEAMHDRSTTPSTRPSLGKKTPKQALDDGVGQGQQACSRTTARSTGADRRGGRDRGRGGAW